MKISLATNDNVASILTNIYKIWIYVLNYAAPIICNYFIFYLQFTKCLPLHLTIDITR